MKAKKICFDKPNLAPKEAAAYLNILISTLWRFTKKAEFPKPKRLSDRTILFNKSELDDYLQRMGA